MKKNNTTDIELLSKKTFWTRLKSEKHLQIMALLGVIWMIIFNYAPMYGILVAFKQNYNAFVLSGILKKRMGCLRWICSLHQVLQR